MNKDIRDKSADRGWSDMLAMLDAEMPVRNKRRPVIWWWLLAASVTGIVLFRQFSERFAEPSDNSVPRQQDISVPMASLVPAGKVTHIAETGRIPAENRTVPRQTSPVSNDTGSLSVQSGTLNKTETEVINNQIHVSDSTFSENPESYPVPVTRVLTSLKQTLPALVSTGTETHIIQPVNTDFPPRSIQTQKKGRTGITVGATAGNSLTGVSAGFVYTRHTGRRTAVRGGFSMTIFSPSPGTRPVLIFSDQDYLGATKFAFESSDQFGNAVLNQDVFTQSGQFVEVPVQSWIAAELAGMIQYKLTRKLSLQTGAVGSLTAMSIISPLNYTADVVLQPDKSARNSLESLAAPVIRKFATDWATGISWFGGRHIEWGLNVRVPLNQDIRYRKVSSSMVAASNSGLDTNDTSFFNSSRTSPLLTASAIWNF